MTLQDRVAFASALAECARIFGKAKDLDEMGESYWLALQDLDLSAVQAGLRACARSCRYFPKPAEIREQAELSQAAVRRVSGDQALSCELCGWSTWQPRYCHGLDMAPPPVGNAHGDFEAPCQRPFRHAAHGYMVRCECWRARHAREDVA